eukprot:CAMPEP_0179188944 /NCGR_PEP_ID=MMETSP0796-20121207/93787_1 /TAXON_ID=73915 /ORGANISM="Pyrodinium bahamense, Strain pbaha01" /LENGTH=39 /DNA_ID= /DNA_START= /DNA_END= /DNA_ORIENTATION=
MEHQNLAWPMAPEGLTGVVGELAHSDMQQSACPACGDWS